MSFKVVSRFQLLFHEKKNQGELVLLVLQGAHVEV